MPVNKFDGLARTASAPGCAQTCASGQTRRRRRGHSAGGKSGRQLQRIGDVRHRAAIAALLKVPLSIRVRPITIKVAVAQVQARPPGRARAGSGHPTCHQRSGPNCFVAVIRWLSASSAATLGSAIPIAVGGRLSAPASSGVPSAPFVDGAASFRRFRRPGAGRSRSRGGPAIGALAAGPARTAAAGDRHSARRVAVSAGAAGVIGVAARPAAAGARWPVAAWRAWLVAPASRPCAARGRPYRRPPAASARRRSGCPSFASSPPLTV